MRKIQSYLRILLIMTLSYLTAEWVIDEPKGTVLFNPYVLGFLFLIFLLVVSFEAIIGVLERIADQLTSPEQRKAIEETKKQKALENNWKKRFGEWLMGKKTAPDAQLLLEDHNYDGIRELDNPLPPWWLYLFYVTLLFGVIYLGYYHLFDGPNQEQNFEQEMALANEQIETYKKTAASFVDETNVTVLKDVASLENGRSLFETHCAVCHQNDGGGSIGPNLTDNYWILGGDIKSIFLTIAKGGRPGKGMIAWNNSLKPQEIQQLSSFILSLKGTTPQNPKAPEGTLMNQ